MSGIPGLTVTVKKKPKTPVDPRPGAKVLVVDDMESSIFVVNLLLEPYGMKVETAMSGPGAIDKIKGGSVYDIIFMDQMMPGMDGMETTVAIRNLGYKGPIVALTANAEEGHMELSLKSGFDDYIPKPVGVDSMSAVIDKFIRKQPSAAAATQAVDKPSAADNPPGNSGSLERFPDESLKAIEILEATREEKDIELFTAAVRGLKDTLANSGKPALSSFAAKLEKAAIDKDYAAINEKTPVFIEKLKEAIERDRPKAP